MIPELRTPRLLLVPAALADAEAIQQEFPRWEIVRLMTAAVPWPYPVDGALTFLRDVALPEMARGQAWHWTLRPLEAPDALAGFVSLRRGEKDNRGFWVAPAWQGRGLATEACEAVTRFWFEVLGRQVLRVSKAAANEPSRRISASEGMRLVATEEHDFVSGRLPAEIWEITAEEWRARRQAAPRSR